MFRSEISKIQTPSPHTTPICNTSPFPTPHPSPHHHRRTTIASRPQPSPPSTTSADVHNSVPVASRHRLTPGSNAIASRLTPGSNAIASRLTVRRLTPGSNAVVDTATRRRRPCCPRRPPPASPPESRCLSQCFGFIASTSQVHALIVEKFIRHPDTDVKVAVAFCLSEITRISAPDAPYDDVKMKVRSCVIMLDLECDGLVIEMFQHFFCLRPLEILILITSSHPWD